MDVGRWRSGWWEWQRWREEREIGSGVWSGGSTRDGGHRVVRGGKGLGRVELLRAREERVRRGVGSGGCVSKHTVLDVEPHARAWCLARTCGRMTTKAGTTREGTQGGGEVGGGSGSGRGRSGRLGPVFGVMGARGTEDIGSNGGGMVSGGWSFSGPGRARPARRGLGWLRELTHRLRRGTTR